MPSEDVMDREQFIRVLRGCIESATGRDYPNIDWTRLSDRGLIETAELVRDLLERRTRDPERPEKFPPPLLH
jgi:hypothetical protein